MARIKHHVQGAKNSTPKKHLGQLVRPAEPVAGDLVSHLCMTSYLWNVTIAPDATTEQRNAASVEYKLLDKALRAIRGF